MSALVLTLKNVPKLRVDLRSLVPAAVGALSPAEVEKLPVPYGNRLLPLGEWFSASRHDGADGVRFEGDLSRFDRIGWQMAAGRIVVDGSAGDYAGGCMSGGELQVNGDSGLLTACEMAGGTLTVTGSVGDFAAGTLPGSMDGMRGGTLIVRGNAGARFGDRMRRGSALVFGNAGEFLASRMVAGTIALGGSSGAHVGYGMRRGSVVFAGSTPSVGPTFVPLIADAPVFWQLLARDLARHGGPFAGLSSQRVDRFAGDAAVGGKGELIFPR